METTNWMASQGECLGVTQESSNNESKTTTTTTTTSRHYWQGIIHTTSRVASSSSYSLKGCCECCGATFDVRRQSRQYRSCHPRWMFLHFIIRMHHVILVPSWTFKSLSLRPETAIRVMRAPVRTSDERTLPNDTRGSAINSMCVFLSHIL